MGWVTGKFVLNEKRDQVMDGVMGVADGVGDVRLGDLIDTPAET